MVIGYPAGVIAILYGFYDGRGRILNFIAFTVVLCEGALVGWIVSDRSPNVLAAAVIIFLAVGYFQIRRIVSGSRSLKASPIPSGHEDGH